VGLILEIKAGPLARKSLSITSGKFVIVGRASNRAQFAIPLDTHMSAVHFAVECGPNSDGCIVPLDHGQFHQLMHGLTMSHGGKLIVAETIGGERFA
jgi:hypothetical protein